MLVPHKQKHEEIIRKKLIKCNQNADLPIWVLSETQYEDIEMKKILKKLEKVHISTFICSTRSLNKPTLRTRL